jgi:hypothetical protein
MNPRIFSLICGLMLVMTAQAALAQPSTVVADVGAPAAQTSINVNVTFTPAAGNTNAAQFDINFNKTELSANIAAVCPALWVCSQTAGGIRLVSPFASGGALAGININVPFDLTLAVDNTTYPLTLAGELYANAANQPLAPSGSSDGSIEILPPPEPAFLSSPIAAAGVTVPAVVQNATDTSANVVISNPGDPGSTLTGECTETDDADSVFSLSGNTSFSVLQSGGDTDTVTVTCDSAGTIATHTGEMSCDHDGTNAASPQVYALSCTITAGPQPAYSSSNPTVGEGVINLSVDEAGDDDPTQTMTITNSGAATTTLIGTCAMDGSSDPEITLITAGGFNILQGTAGSMKTVSCDASVQGNFEGTLACTHNGASPASPVEYDVLCTVPEAGSADFDSDPEPGPVDVANGADVVVGDPDPVRNLTFFNLADPGDQQLDLSCDYSGHAAIIPSSANLDVLLAPGDQTGVSFTCDTAASGIFTGTYNCFYQDGGVEPPVGDKVPVPNAVYELSCEVREPEAQVEITPAPGTPQTKTVPPGGSTSFLFDFEEVNDEGEDGQLHNCYLDSGAQGFSITSPVEVLIGSGSTVSVVVDFTDPTGADSWSDTLTCEYSDADSDDALVSWLLTVNIGGDARFTVLKEFTDGNPGEVTVELDCNTGLILDQDKDITEDGIGVTFVVTDYTAGNLACNVKELPVAGYSAEYDASGSESDFTDVDDPDDDAGCYWTEIEGGVENICVITNSPDPVDVVINKEWLYPGSSGATDVSNEFEILLVCENAEIVDGNEYCGFALSSGVEFSESIIINDSSCKWLEGSGDETFTEQVIPYDWPGGTCYAVEVDVDPAVEVENGCSAPMTISAGGGASCTITNTVFYEGIPTLSEYGMALLALLMLGVGFVAVRRIA